MRVVRRHELEIASIVGHVRAMLAEVVQEGLVCGPAYPMHTESRLTDRGCRGNSQPAPHPLPTIKPGATRPEPPARVAGPGSCREGQPRTRRRTPPTAAAP